MSINKMPIKYFLIVLSFLFIISCNKNSNGTNKNEQRHNDLTNVEKSVLNNVQKPDDLNNTEEPALIAVINTDCDYYTAHGNAPSAGKLTKGQSVNVLDYCYTEETSSNLIINNFIIYVEVETLDKTIKGRVQESYLTYPNNHNLWFKDILFTRSYYYTESAEYIYKEEGLSLIDEGVSERQSILMMKHFFSESRLLISERHLGIGNGGYGVFEVYRILSINEKNENTYLLKLRDHSKEEFEIALFVDNDSITIMQFVAKNKIFFQSLFERALNIKYIAYNKEKSEKTKAAVLAWCDEQVKKLK